MYSLERFTKLLSRLSIAPDSSIVRSRSFAEITTSRTSEASSSLLYGNSHRRATKYRHLIYL